MQRTLNLNSARLNAIHVDYVSYEFDQPVRSLSSSWVSWLAASAPIQLSWTWCGRIWPATAWPTTVVRWPPASLSPRLWWSSTRETARGQSCTGRLRCRSSTSTPSTPQRRPSTVTVGSTSRCCPVSVSMILFVLSIVWVCLRLLVVLGGLRSSLLIYPGLP